MNYFQLLTILIMIDLFMTFFLFNREFKKYWNDRKTKKHQFQINKNVFEDLEER